MDDHAIPPGEYLIPRRIARGYQIMPGMGLKEVGFALAGIVAAVVVWYLLALVGVPWLFRAVVAGVPLFVGGALALPLDDIHVWEWVRDFWVFRQKPKTLLYDWTADDW